MSIRAVHAVHLFVRLALAATTGLAWLPTVAAPGAGLPARPDDVPTVTRPDQAGCPWIAPVDAPVVDGFRAPSHPYGPGNRGLEYAAAAGQPVTAVASGRVGFVGPVGGRRYLVVEHAGGLRSTYGPLQSVAVVRGQSVAAGEGIGAAAPGLLLTARIGQGDAERYIDPAPLLAGRCGRARLVAARPGSPGAAARADNQR